jgi:hypothetical protein
MDYSAETLPIVTPAQIGSGIDGSCDSLPEEVRRTEGQNTAQRAR